MYIYDGRREFARWDTNVKIADSNFKVGEEIHFSNGTQTEALVVKAYQLNDKVVVDVPNILLQSAGTIRAMRYATDGSSEYTAAEQSFTVTDRPKPADYIYTETATVTIESAVAEATEAMKDELKAYVDEAVLGGEW